MGPRRLRDDVQPVATLWDRERDRLVEAVGELLEQRLRPGDEAGEGIGLPTEPASSPPET